MRVLGPVRLRWGRRGRAGEGLRRREGRDLAGEGDGPALAAVRGVPEEELVPRSLEKRGAHCGSGRRPGGRCEAVRERGDAARRVLEFGAAVGSDPLRVRVRLDGVGSVGEEGLDVGADLEVDGEAGEYGCDGDLKWTQGAGGKQEVGIGSAGRALLGGRHL